MIFIIELGIWVLRACAVSHTDFVTFFDGGGNENEDEGDDIDVDDDQDVPEDR